jgi:hypothetical protein
MPKPKSKVDPTFKLGSKLARYIHPHFRRGSRRPSPAAFMLRKEMNETALSVNSLDIHSLKQIATIHAAIQNDTRPLAIAERTVKQFNDAIGKVITLKYDAATKAWKHPTATGYQDSYVYTPKKNNSSHCDVRMFAELNGQQSFSVAVALAHKPTYKFI